MPGIGHFKALPDRLTSLVVGDAKPCSIVGPQEQNPICQGPGGKLKYWKGNPLSSRQGVHLACVSVPCGVTGVHPCA